MAHIIQEAYEHHNKDQFLIMVKITEVIFDCNNR